MAKRIHQMTVKQWEAAFPNDDACKAYLTANRWPAGVVCPRCGNPDAREHGSRAFHWQCYACSAKGTSYRFSVTVGTIFENTKYPLREWFRVIHLMLTSKKGISALQIHRMIGTGSYETAWSMCHRIRAAMIDKNFRQLIGIVECDETFVGGKIQNKHIGKRGWDKHGGGALGKGSNKAIVAGAVERGGKVFARVLKDVSAATLNSFVREVTSDKVSLVCTDAFSAYKRLGMHRPHASVDHASGEYVRHDDELAGVIHTQTIEGFWSLIKRGIMGTYHKVSHKYLPLYVAEFQFRYNNRLNEDIFAEAIRGC
jgi:transposase-like protein/IS1 family transposase